MRVHARFLDNRLRNDRSPVEPFTRNTSPTRCGVVTPMPSAGGRATTEKEFKRTSLLDG